MSKQSGLGDGFLLDGYDLSGDVGSIGPVRGGPSPLVMTGIDKSAIERLGGKFDSEISWKSWFNPSAAAEHPVLSTLPRTARIVTYCRGRSIGSPAASLQCKQINYDPTRGDDGSLSIAVQTMGSEGTHLEWGEQLTAFLRTDTTATNGASLDGLAATAFGLSAYLHVSALTGTDITLALEDSANNSDWAAIASGAFAATTLARTTQRIRTGAAAAVRRYVRVVSSGTFTSATFHVMFARHASTVAS